MQCSINEKVIRTFLYSMIWYAESDGGGGGVGSDGMASDNVNRGFALREICRGWGSVWGRYTKS